MVSVLTLPGWQSSGPEHWQSRWEALYGCQRVEQADWMQPRSGDWIARLEQAVQTATPPVVLVAHSLGCVLAVRWALASALTARVRGALLVAPPDVERDSAPQPVREFGAPPLEILPFRSMVVASTSDPYCSFMRSGLMAAAWGAEFVNVGDKGHINAESRLGDWPEGWRWVQDGLKEV